MRKFSLWIKILVVFSICAAIIGEVKADPTDESEEPDQRTEEVSPGEAETETPTSSDTSGITTDSPAISAEPDKNSPVQETKPPAPKPPGTQPPGTQPPPADEPSPESEPEEPAPDPEVSGPPPQTETTTKSISISTKPIVALTVGAVIGKMLAF